jgi:hypothetical protein
MISAQLSMDDLDFLAQHDTETARIKARAKFVDPDLDPIPRHGE